MIDISKPNKGRPQTVPITKKVMILLLKDIFQLSNRKMANMLALFSALTGIKLSYKSVERIYSDELARMIIHNMFILLVKKKGIKNVDVSGDGTGYSLTITKHYRNEKSDRKCFAYVFALMDIHSGMYIGYGSSMKSEKDAFKKAIEMVKDVSIKSVRLDKLYSVKSITKDFSKETRIYIIPKKDATVRGSVEWKNIIRSYVFNTFSHLKEYYKRNKSESGFSSDKRMCGWKIWQRREERIDTALLCKGVWHNLMLLY